MDHPRWPALLVLAALLVVNTTGMLYCALDIAPPDGFDRLMSLGLTLSVLVWFIQYCRAMRISWLMDMGWFFIMVWPVLVPYYVIRTEGRRGLKRVGIFLLAYIVTWGLAWVGASAIGALVGP